MLRELIRCPLPSATFPKSECAARDVLAVARGKGAASCPRDLRQWWEHTALGLWRQHKREQGVEHTASAAGRQLAGEPGQQHRACRECWCMGLEELEGKRSSQGSMGDPLHVDIWDVFAQS